MSVKLTNEEFLKRFYERYSQDYDVLDEYTGRKNKMRVRHRNCTYPTGEFIYETTPNVLLDIRRIHICPFCARNYRWTYEKFVEYMGLICPDIECLGGFVDSMTKMKFRCKKCLGIFDRAPIGFTKTDPYKCPYCSPFKHLVLKGYNDMWTTDPEMAKYLKNHEDGYKYSSHSSEELWWKCLDCGFEYKKAPSRFVLDVHGKLKCPCCGDGVSYPEKFMFCFLNQLDVDFTMQLSCTTFEWCGSYRYDFYLNDYNTIIEVNGIQHYDKDTSWGYDNILNSDLTKKDLALNNGIDHYVIIDCRYSDKNYIKKSIEESYLNEIFNLNLVDFDFCDTNASKKIIPLVCSDWNTGKYSIQQLSEKYPVGIQCIKLYLKQGSKLGICSYNPQEELFKSWEMFMHRQCKPVYCIELNRIFDSRQQVKRELGFTLNSPAIDNPNRVSGGYHWRTLTKDEMEQFKNKTLLNKHILNESLVG